MDADEQRVQSFLQNKGLTTERFSKPDIRKGKTPDFRVLHKDKLQFFCEVKSIREDCWLDKQLKEEEPGQLVGGARNDPIFNRLTADIHDALKQFEAVNKGQEHPNVLALVNHDVMCGFNDLLAILTGSFYAEDGTKPPIYKQFSHGRIREEKGRIHLFFWLNDHNPDRLLFSQTNEGHHAKLLAAFGFSQNEIMQVDL